MANLRPDQRMELPEHTPVARMVEDAPATRHGVRDLDSVFAKKRALERRRAAAEAEATALEKSATSRLLLAEEWQTLADTLRAEAAEKQAEASKMKESVNTHRSQS